MKQLILCTGLPPASFLARVDTRGLPPFECFDSVSPFFLPTLFKPVGKTDDCALFGRGDFTFAVIFVDRLDRTMETFPTVPVLVASIEDGDGWVFVEVDVASVVDEAVGGATSFLVIETSPNNGGGFGFAADMEITVESVVGTASSILRRFAGYDFTPACRKRRRHV